MKFGQFIEYNMKIFLMKNYPMVEKLVPETFIKNQSCTHLWTNRLKCHKFLFIVSPSQGLPKYIKTKLLTIGFYKAILKNKEQSGTSILASFSA